MPDVLFINGRFTTTDERVLGVEDRGFLFGDAVYEVFKFVSRRPAFLAEHFLRLEKGLQAIEIPNPWNDAASFGAAMRELLDRTQFDDGIVYIQVTRGEAERAHFWQDDLTPPPSRTRASSSFPTPQKKSAASKSSPRPICAGSSAM